MDLKINKVILAVTYYRKTSKFHWSKRLVKNRTKIESMLLIHSKFQNE